LTEPRNHGPQHDQDLRYEPEDRGFDLPIAKGDEEEYGPSHKKQRRDPVTKHVSHGIAGRVRYYARMERAGSFGTFLEFLHGLQDSLIGSMGSDADSDPESIE
jgi:hypothetical protein